MPSPDGYQGEANTIRSWFVDGWDSGVPIHLIENSSFTERPDNAPWACLTIRGREGGPVTVGGPLRRHRYPGDVILQVFVPEGVGDSVARELADLACDILRDKQDGGITVWSVRAIPLEPRDGWYRINVLASFSRDQTHTA